jgi:hypothetical protein
MAYFYLFMITKSASCAFLCSAHTPTSHPKGWLPPNPKTFLKNLISGGKLAVIWESLMLNRLTVSALLKAVILTTSSCVVVASSFNAWDSWGGGRLQVAGRISVFSDASANLFRAVHNLRTDRTTTSRLLDSDAPMDGEFEKYLRSIRDDEMPAMGNALAALGAMEFAQ